MLAKCRKGLLLVCFKIIIKQDGLLSGRLHCLISYCLHVIDWERPCKIRQKSSSKVDMNPGVGEQLLGELFVSQYQRCNLPSNLTL